MSLGPAPTPEKIKILAPLPRITKRNVFVPVGPARCLKKGHRPSNKRGVCTRCRQVLALAGAVLLAEQP